MARDSSSPLALRRTTREPLANQVAVVSGASGGIGGAIASALAGKGCTLCLIGRDRAKLEETASRTGASNGRVNIQPTDLTDDEDVKRLAESLTEEFGKIDILVHSAGAAEYGKLEDAPISMLDRQYRSNVSGPLLLTQMLLPLLKRPKGQIVFLNSSVGLAAQPAKGHYSATQHAVKALADALRDEVNSENVRVLSVYPGRTATDRTRALYASEHREYQPDLLLQPEDVATIILCALTLPWTAEVTDIRIRPMLKSY